MKPNNLFWLVLCVAVLLPACTIVKRHYRNGFYFGRTGHAHGTTVNATDADSNVRIMRSEESVLPLIESEEPTRDSLAVNKRLQASAEIKVQVKEDTAVAENPVVHSHTVRTPDDVPPDEDHPNRKIMWLILLAMFLVACALFGMFGLPSMFLQVVFFVLLPLTGTGLFAYALWYRQKILRRVVAGESGDELTLSDHFSKFALPLYMFFGGAVLGCAGLILLYFSGILLSGLVEWFGVIMLESAIIIMPLMLLVLLVLCLFYFFKWKRKGEGRKKPWQLRPKDG